MRLDSDLARAALLLMAVTSGCSSSPSSSTVTPHPTIVEVSPEEFLGAPACVAAPGAFQAYVATLTDVGVAEGVGGSAGGGDSAGSGGSAGGGGAPAAPTPFALPSSALVPCNRGVAFGWIAPGHLYEGIIEGYDRSDLVPLAPGLPIQLDPDSGEPVAPRWKAMCRRTRAESQVTRRVTACGPWSGPDETLPTAVRLSISAALGDVACGDGPDQVQRFVVRRAGEELASGACDEEVTLEGLTADEFTTFEVLAFSSDASAASLGTLCLARPAAGVSVDAQCQPLSSTGALSLSVKELLAAATLRCDSNLDSIALTLDGTGPALLLTSKDCAGIRHFADLTPGEHTLEATVRLRGADPVQLRCSAEVEPGLVVAAACAAAGEP